MAIVDLGLAFVGVGASEPVNPSVAAPIVPSAFDRTAFAFERTDRVGARGMLVAQMAARRTLVDVRAFPVDHRIPISALAIEPAKRIRTRRKFRAVVFLRFAFVYIIALLPVALESLVALAKERANHIHALRIGVAVMVARRAFVLVDALVRLVDDKASLAFAFEAANRVVTFGQLGAIVFPGHALVNIGTFLSVSFVSRLASAHVGANGVGARRVLVALMVVGRALVDVGARVSVAKQPVFAFAFEAANRIRAFGEAMTRSPLEALVHILARFPVALVSRFAAARVAAGLVEANGVGVAVVRVVGAFVDFFAFDAVAGIPGQARTVKPANFVTASRLFRTVVSLRRAFVDVLALQTVALEVHEAGQSRSTFARK